MSQEVGAFNRQVKRKFWLIAIASWLVGLGLILLAPTMSQMSVLAALAVAGGGTAMAGLMALRSAHGALEETAQAVAHVTTSPASQPPPQPTSEVAKDLAGQVYQVAGTTQTLTNNIQADREHLKAVFDLLPAAVFVFDLDQKLVLMNAGAEQVLSVKPGELDGLAQPQVLDWVFQTDHDYDKWLAEARSGKVHDQILWERVSILTKNNQRVIGDLSVHYEKNESHNIETALVFVDRTPQYQADEAQLDFVAVAAHELRGPITVIRGYLDVFQDEMKSVFNVEQQALLQKMTVSAEMLSLYVNNILNVARVDQQIMPLHVIEADWREVLKEAYADLFLRAKAHGRILKIEMPNSMSTVAVDRISILEVINNLVDNAIKYSSEGGEITIRTAEQQGLISTTVTDHGIGIPDAILGNLFKKFYRSHKTRTGVSGTGLGLYLSKAIIDAHGGNIWVKSQVGTGSTFGFDLPTFATVADTLKKGDNDPSSIKRSSHGWIKNHAMYRPAQANEESEDDKPSA